MKAYSVHNVDDEAFGTYGQRQLSVIFMNGGTQVETDTTKFDADTMGWQYLCSAAIALVDYTSVIFRFAYPKSCNQAWFDGLQL